jgi:6-phospho-beta-glucosidase
MGIKIAVIGGASSYTPELFANLIEMGGQLEVEQVTLQDIDYQKLRFIAEVCRRVVRESKAQIQATIAQNLDEAIAGADFIILQIRVGGSAARIRDERLPMEFGMVGNETVGAGGFICSLRTIPVALQITKSIERLAPKAWLMNLSNPAGIVTEVILKQSKVRVIGFCNIPINTQYDLAAFLGVSPEEINMDYFGLNHLSWVRGVYVHDREMLQPLLAKIQNRRSALYKQGLVDPLIDPAWLTSLRMIPRWYNRYYYYPRESLNEDRRNKKVQGEEDMIAEERLHQIYESVGYNQEARYILGEKGGAQYYLPVIQAIDSIVHDKGKIIIIDVTNGNALPDLPPDACVEVPTRVHRESLEPLPVGWMPLSVRGLVQAVKNYEELTLEAAITGDRKIAIAALMANPLVGSYPKAKKFLDRALENEQDYFTSSNGKVEL